MLCGQRKTVTSRAKTGEVVCSQEHGVVLVWFKICLLVFARCGILNSGCARIIVIITGVFGSPDSGFFGAFVPVAKL